MDITLGRTVYYMLSEEDAKQINRRRTSGGSIAARMKNAIPPQEGQNSDTIYGWPAGAQAHIGNEVEAGQVYPAVAVRIWSTGCANFQVSLDGNDTYWATSRTEGTQPGTWAWPPRV